MSPDDSKFSRKSLIFINVVLAEAGLVLFLSVIHYTRLNTRFEFQVPAAALLVLTGILAIVSIILADELVRLARVEQKLREAERMAALGELAAGIAHEIRNPMSSLSGFVQMIKIRLDQGDALDESELRLYLGTMESSVNQVENLVAEFLMLANPPARYFEPVRLDVIISSIMRSMRPMAAEKQVALEMEYDPDLPEAVVDRQGIRQVLMNLILNAIQHTDPGGEVEVRARYVSGERQFILSVIDSGEGIPPENLDKVFSPFFTTRSDGTGLGLAVSKRIVEGHGGRITVESRPGHGSTFSVFLPFESARA